MKTLATFDTPDEYWTLPAHRRNETGWTYSSPYMEYCGIEHASRRLGHRILSSRVALPALSILAIVAVYTAAAFI